MLTIINSPNIFLPNQDKLDQNGLHSEIIFGPIKKDKCSCGNLKGKENKGKICKICRVSCDDNTGRYTNFAKIQLITPVIKTTEKKKLNFIKTEFYIIDPVQNQRAADSFTFLSYNEKTNDLYLSDSFIVGYSSPLRLTGNVSLFLSLKYFKEIRPSITKINEYLDLFYTDLLITPPQTRMYAVTGEGNNTKFIISPLDKTYSTIISTQNIIKNLFNYENIELYLNEMLNSKNSTYNNSDIIDFDKYSAKIQKYCDDIYASVLEKLEGKKGQIRKNFLSKTIDFCARSVVSPNPKLKTYEIIIPKKTFFKLFLLEFLYYINTKNNNENLKLDIKSITYKLTDKIDEIINTQIANDFIEYFFSDNVDSVNKLIYLNRQPTLWRYGLLGVQIVGVTDEDVIFVSPFIVDTFGMDFDGDSGQFYIEFLNKNNKLIQCHVSEFLKHIDNFTIIKSDIHDTYLINEDVKIKSINTTTGKIEYNKINFYHKHYNLEMYEVIHKDIKEEIIISNKHSLIVFDNFNNQIISESVENILLNPNRYSLMIDD